MDFINKYKLNQFIFEEYEECPERWNSLKMNPIMNNFQNSREYGVYSKKIINTQPMRLLKDIVKYLVSLFSLRNEMVYSFGRLQL